jgi:GT2 family glycosyltransferase
MAADGNLTLSVIVVTHNSARFIRRCLDSVSRHLAALPHDIHVVDNASQDETVSLVKTHSSRAALIPNARNRGFAAAVNQGLKQSRGRYVLWLNPDAELLDDHFSELVAYGDRNPRVGILGPQLVNPDGTRQLSCRSFPSYRTAFFHRYSLLTRWFPSNRRSRNYLHSDWDGGNVREVDWVSGACLLHRRTVAEELLGLDERFFMYCEDVDFCFRAKRRGWLVQCHPAARVLHWIGGSTAAVHRKMILERHRSMWRYYAKHFRRNPAKDLAVGITLGTRCGLIMLRRGD